MYRLAFQLTSQEYGARFGDPPARPPRGGVVALGFALAALGVLTPHPVYAWMGWVQVLSPTADHFARVRPVVEESLSLAKVKWDRRRPR